MPKVYIVQWFEPPHDKTNKAARAPSEDSDQPGHLLHPPSLIRIFAVRFMGSLWPKLSSCGQRRLIRLGGCPGWSVFAGRTGHFVGFAMRHLKSLYNVNFGHSILKKIISLWRHDVIHWITATSYDKQKYCTMFLYQAIENFRQVSYKISGFWIKLCWGHYIALFFFSSYVLFDYIFSVYKKWICTCKWKSPALLTWCTWVVRFRLQTQRSVVLIGTFIVKTRRLTKNVSG